MVENAPYLHMPGCISKCQLCWTRLTEQVQIKSPPALETRACPLRFRDYNEPFPVPLPVTLGLGQTVFLLSALQAYFLICRLLTGDWLPKGGFGG